MSKPRIRIWVSSDWTSAVRHVFIARLCLPAADAGPRNRSRTVTGRRPRYRVLWSALAVVSAYDLVPRTRFRRVARPVRLLRAYWSRERPVGVALAGLAGRRRARAGIAGLQGLPHPHRHHPPPRIPAPLVGHRRRHD